MAQEQQKQEVQSQPTTGATEQASSETKGMAKRPHREVDVGRVGERIAPLTALRRMMADMDRLFSGFGFGSPFVSVPSLVPSIPSPVELFGEGTWSPAIETMERDGKLVFRADLPGLGKDDVKVEIVGDELIVSGERKQEHEETKGGRYYSECRYGSFERRILLPEDVDPESVEATFENGVLEICLAAPERAKPQAKKIEIKSSSGEKHEKEEEKGAESIH